MNTKRNLRIIFMGTPEFAVASLKALLDAGFKVVAVVTAPDRPAGRGRKIVASAVKRFAEEHNLPVLQPTSLKDEGFISDLASFQANLNIVVAFRMLPKVVWNMPEFGTFNLHASLLPDYRGAAPINWALINGVKETGVTTFFIDDTIDTGHIIFQEKMSIGDYDTAGDLHDQLMVLGANLVVKTTLAIQNGPVTTREQVISGSVSEAPKLTRDNCRIKWNNEVQEIHNHIRGLSPYPAAWTELYNGAQPISVKILRALPMDEPASKPAGCVDVIGRKLMIHTADRLLEIEELQLEGKSRMPVSNLLNGFSLKPDAYFN